jgi:hypothetical protein
MARHALQHPSAEGVRPPSQTPSAGSATPLREVLEEPSQRAPARPLQGSPRTVSTSPRAILQGARTDHQNPPPRPLRGVPIDASATSRTHLGERVRALRGAPRRAPPTTPPRGLALPHDEFLNDPPASSRATATGLPGPSQRALASSLQGALTDHPNTLRDDPREALTGHPNTLRDHRSEGSQNPRLGNPRDAPSATMCGRPRGATTGSPNDPSKTSPGTSRRAPPRPLQGGLPQPLDKLSQHPSKGLPRPRPSPPPPSQEALNTTSNQPAQRLPRTSPSDPREPSNASATTLPEALADHLDTVAQRLPATSPRASRERSATPCPEAPATSRGATRRALPPPPRKSQTSPATMSRRAFRDRSAKHPPPPARRSHSQLLRPVDRALRDPPRAPRQPSARSSGGSGTARPDTPDRLPQRSRCPLLELRWMPPGHRSRRRLTTCRASPSSGTGGRARPPTR